MTIGVDSGERLFISLRVMNANSHRAADGRKTSLTITSSFREG